MHTKASTGTEYPERRANLPGPGSSYTGIQGTGIPGVACQEQPSAFLLILVLSVRAVMYKV